MADYVVACMQDGDLRAVKDYIETLSSVNEYVYEDDDNQLNTLHLAVGLDSRFREEIIELLIQLRADINCPGKSDNVDGVRPIHLASMWGYDLTVKLLLYHGADAALRDSNGYSAVDYASIFDNYLCISLLLRYGSLNSTATAWSAIMDSSFGDTSLDDDCHYTTAVEFNTFAPAGDHYRLNSTVCLESESETTKSSATSKRSADRTLSPDDHDRHHRHQSSSEEQPDREQDDDADDDDGDDHDDDDDDDDPLDLIRDEDIDLDMDNLQLRSQLKRFGRNPGPITGTTKKLYAKLLAHLAKENREPIYSPRTTSRSKANGYSLQLNSIITGKFPLKQALGLEKEFITLSGIRDYHGPKQFFNYILLDPRVSRNLAEQAMEASDSDTSKNHSNNSSSVESSNPKHAMKRVNRKFNPKLFAKFIESIFYIGKGQKKRDLMHLYDALADRGSITHAKIERIRSIWDDGYGVVSLHLFHNITSKEALTREALMIDCIGLGSLTNLLRGTFQIHLGWDAHQRNVLGALLIHRAYIQLLNEGERQLKREDLKF